jgi:hypothetical protein
MVFLQILHNVRKYFYKTRGQMMNHDFITDSINIVFRVGMRRKVERAAGYVNQRSIFVFVS